MNSQPLQEPLYWVSTRRMATRFPPLSEALDEPNGLLAIGGDLGVCTLLSAYRQGIFPWYSAGQPILWWSPEPRAVLIPAQFHLSRSLARRMRHGGFEVTFDGDFTGVIDGCAAPRNVDAGTWITAEMRSAYLELHAHGHAHSIEYWRDGELRGGLYGVAVGRAFFGESMFSRESNASKIVLAHLCRWLRAWEYALLDCQMHTSHLASLGACEMPRAQFAAQLATLVEQTPSPLAWRREAAMS